MQFGEGSVGENTCTVGDAVWQVAACAAGYVVKVSCLTVVMERVGSVNEW